MCFGGWGGWELMLMVSRCGKSFNSCVTSAFAKISGQNTVLNDRKEAEEMDSAKGIA